MRARYSPACVSEQHWRRLPRNRDWAAQSLKICAPPSFDGAFGSVHERSPAVSMRSQDAETVPHPKVTSHLAKGVSPPDEELWNCQRKPERGQSSPAPSPSINYGEPTPRAYRGVKGSPKPVDQQSASQHRSWQRNRTPIRGRRRDNTPPKTDPDRRPTAPPSPSWNRG